MPEPVVDYIITPHALQEIARRGIDEGIVKQVLSEPEQREVVRKGRELLQSRVEMFGKSYVVRVFVDVDRRPAEVVTVYRTSKITKYWRDTR
jgi:hypothetical protein